MAILRNGEGLLIPINFKGTVDDIASLPPTGNVSGDLYVILDIDELRIWDDLTTSWVNPAGTGWGDVSGPAGATDNAAARFDGITGKLLKDSLVTIDNSGSIGMPPGATVGGVDVTSHADRHNPSGVDAVASDEILDQKLFAFGVGAIDFTTSAASSDSGPTITKKIVDASVSKLIDGDSSNPGIGTDPPENRCILRDRATNDPIEDTSGRQIYGRVTSAEVVQGGVWTWDGTTTVAATDTSGVSVGDFIRNGAGDPLFEITGITPNVDVTISNPGGLTIPSGAGAEAVDLTLSYYVEVAPDTETAHAFAAPQTIDFIFIESLGLWTAPFAALQSGVAFLEVKPSAHTHPLSAITDVTASAAEVNVLDGFLGSTAELNEVTDGSDVAAATHHHDSKYADITHATSHENGGADEISVAGLSGLLADAQNPTAHGLGGAAHSADTLANLNTKISDATLDDSSASRPPSGSASGQLGGSYPGPDVRGIRETAGPTLLTITGIADGAFLRRSGTNLTGDDAKPPSSLTEQTGTITTTSGTDVLATGMTITPAAGTYLVWFTGSVSHSAANGTVNMSIWSAGAIVASSERLFANASHGAVYGPFSCVARVTVNGAQAIEGKWRTSGATASMYQRSIALLKVS